MREKSFMSRRRSVQCVMEVMEVWWESRSFVRRKKMLLSWSLMSCSEGLVSLEFERGVPEMLAKTSVRS